MKYWKEILDVIPCLQGSLNDQLVIKDITANSKEVKPGCAFIAIKGLTVDGHNYITDAIKNGAVAILGTDLSKLENLDVVWCQIDKSKFDPAKIASEFYGNPSREFKLVGITGTNGKTTTARLLYDLFKSLGYKVGLVSTIEILIDDQVRQASHTTPDAINLQRVFRDMVDAQCEYVFMEVSSHAVVQGRVDYVDFDVAVFTNLSHDHLDYHKTFKAYLKAKKLFFDKLKNDAIAIVNTDDKNGLVMVQNTKATVKTYGINAMADYKCKVLSNQSSGLHLLINNSESYFTLSGVFNAYNISAVYAVAMELEENDLEVLTKMSGLKAAKGRLERVTKEGLGFDVYVDYAHTPDALENVLDTLLDMKAESGKIITVLGCGGDRDKTKRPKMAAIAVKKGALSVFTSDNPRSEDPKEIIEEMLEGVEEDQQNKVIKITDREMAIKAACMMATKDDLVLIAGKGHENYQEVNGEKLPFDDKEKVKATLLKL